MKENLSPEISDLRAEIEAKVAAENARAVEKRHLEEGAESLRKILAESPSRLLLAEATIRSIAGEQHQLLASLGRKMVRAGTCDKERWLVSFARALTASAALDAVLAACKSEVATVKKELAETEKRLKQM